jgi:hypothetical protein
MSSLFVRTQVKNFLAANAPTENVIDLTSLFQEVKELIEDNGLGAEDPWLGVQFIGDDEIPIGLYATNEVGKYRENGAIYFHVVSVAKLGNGDSLLTRGEALRNLLRGRRIGPVVIESVSPMNFDSGATLQFAGGWMSGSFICAYQMDLDLGI